MGLGHVGTSEVCRRGSSIDPGAAPGFGIIPRMKRHSGFTWIELVLILAVIGILGAMAIPGIQDTMLKKQVKEGLDLASVAKAGVQSYWKANGEMPANNAKAGVPPKEKIVGSMVKEVAVENVKRFVRPPSGGLDRYDWLADAAQSPYLIGEFVEIKTVWHPIGA